LEHLTILHSAVQHSAAVNSNNVLNNGTQYARAMSLLALLVFIVCVRCVGHACGSS